MNTDIKIIRAFWGVDLKTRIEIPPIPIFPNQIVYVWGIDNEEFLKSRGFKTRLVEEPEYEIHNTNWLIRKLIVIDLALKEFGEMIFLDWDCYILRELDDTFYSYLKEKPIQCPLYTHYINPMKSFMEYNTNPTDADIEYYNEIEKNLFKYSWKLDDMMIIPNFGFFYSRDVTIGESLLKIARDNDVRGVVDETSLFIYINCTLDEYIVQYLPKVVRGVAEEMTDTGFIISNVQKKLNKYIDTKVDMDIYLKHF